MEKREDLTQPEGAVDDAELEETDAELLPDREAMSVIDLGEGGGLGPPAP